MISEIYAAGHDATSAFLIVEHGRIVHYGSHRWGGAVTFDGITHEADDESCEVIAVICALVMCRNNGRHIVNVYTANDDAQRKYWRRQGDNPFMPSLDKHAEGIDVYAERWQDSLYDARARNYRENYYVAKITDLIKTNKQ